MPHDDIVRRAELSSQSRPFSTDSRVTGYHTIVFSTGNTLCDESIISDRQPIFTLAMGIKTLSLPSPTMRRARLSRQHARVK